MNRIEHLLTCLIEECSEVQKEAAKGLRFGLDDTWETDITVAQKLSTEIVDLLAVVEMILGEKMIPEFVEGDLQKKKDKVEHFLKYSEGRGKLQKEVGVRVCLPGGDMINFQELHHQTTLAKIDKHGYIIDSNLPTNIIIHVEDSDRTRIRIRFVTEQCPEGIFVGEIFFTELQVWIYPALDLKYIDYNDANAFQYEDLIWKANDVLQRGIDKNFPAESV